MIIKGNRLHKTNFAEKVGYIVTNASDIASFS